jgi:glutamate synthase domain-containing protein 3
MQVNPNAYTIDAANMHYRQLNTELREAVNTHHADFIEIQNVYGQRYLGTDLHHPVEIHIYGTPGNDLASFMDGPHIIVHGNAQDGCGNTMNDGEVVIYGNAGDVTGHSMRGGTIWIRDNAGYRVGIHMKAYQDKVPTIVIGGTAQHFLGEYMAGGVLVVLGLNLDPHEAHMTNHIGTGMHGGTLYIRGELLDYQIGKGVGKVPLDEEDNALLRSLVEQYAAYFDYDIDVIYSQPFTKLKPLSLRPYGQLYAY